MDGIFAVLVSFTDFDVDTTPAQNIAPNATGEKVAMAFLNMAEDSSHKVLCTLLGFELEAARACGLEPICMCRL
jgi:hypothetical protein